jgi:dTDP-4-amino-4,6-dideoxygalactose transaminase
MTMEQSVAKEEALAIDGGTPASPEFIYLTRPWIGDDEKAEVLDTLNGIWLSRGPKVSQFEEEFAKYTNVANAIAVSSCTAALHVALVAAGIKEGDEVITSPITFPATTNAVIYERATPVLADVDPRTFNIDPDRLEERITPRTKALIPVHIAGQPCEMNRIMEIAKQHNLVVIEDAAHAIAAKYEGKMIGSIGDAGTFSFYASKNLCTGDGGMLTIREDTRLAEFSRVISLHGMSSTAWKRYTKEGAANWELVYPGFKYNMTDIEASLGIHQLRKIEKITELRTKIADMYNERLADVPELTLPFVAQNVRHAWHLYIVTLDLEALTVSRDRFAELLKAENVGTGIHFISVHKQPYYRQHFGFKDEDYPNAAWLSDRILSLPLGPLMNETEVDLVVSAIKKVISQTRR